MDTIADIRHRNLLVLIEEAGGQADLARATGISPAYISQLAGRAKTQSGSRRGIGDETARKLEEGMRKDPGWLDQAELTPSERRLLSLWRTLPLESHDFVLLRLEKLRDAIDEK